MAPFNQEVKSRLDVREERSDQMRKGLLKMEYVNLLFNWFFKCETMQERL